MRIINNFVRLIYPRFNVSLMKKSFTVPNSNNYINFNLKLNSKIFKCYLLSLRNILKMILKRKKVEFLNTFHIPLSFFILILLLNKTEKW